MNLYKSFQQQFQLNFNPLPVDRTKFLLAVSGGIDSIVLANLFFKAGFHFVIAHCNFQLRGEESERDELFVKALSEKYNKAIFIKKFETANYATQNKISIQEAARKLRYDWFYEIINNQSFAGPQYLATAHNADDNIETVVMFFFRGSGIHGLTGINQLDNERKIIRPLLFATRQEILIYAKENSLEWVEDSSNSTEKYTRNFLRNKLIPSLKDFFPEVKSNIADNINRFKEVEQLYKYSIQQYKKKLIEHRGNEIHIPVLKLQNVKPLDTIIWEIIKEYNFYPNQINEIEKLFTSNNSSYIQSSSHRIIKNRNWLIIALNKTEKASHILIKEEDKEVKFEHGILQIEKLQTQNHKLQTERFTAQLDASKIEFPLLLRKWKQGDYFYPLGMQNLHAGRQGKKKLSRFFIDQKLSSTEKEKIWVLESNKKILWIINYRIDDRFKILSSTKEILKITTINTSEF